MLGLCAARLRLYYIPAMFFLEKANKDTQLEYVNRMRQLLEKPNVQTVLGQYPLKTTQLVQTFMPSPSLYLATTEFPKSSRVLIDLDLALSSESLTNEFCNKKSAACLRHRRLSEFMETSAFPHLKYSRQELQGMHVLSQLTQHPINPVEHGQDSFVANASLDPHRTIVKYGSSMYLQSPPPKRRPVAENNSLHILFPGDLGELESSSEESLSDSSPALSAIRSPEVELEDAPHPFMQDFNRLLEIEKEPTDESAWKLTVNKPGTQVYQRKTGDSPICMIKAFCEVGYSAETVFTAIWDKRIRVQWDVLFREFEIVVEQPEYELLYYMIKTPIGITKRDWLQRRVQIRDYPDPGTIILHFVSVEDPAMPPKKGVIRAETLISGYVIRPVSEHTCTVTIISQNDIKGLIPKMLVNKVAAKAPADWVNNMNKGCKLVVSGR